jgi:tetratricopeptide (TPR) repeat protein
MPIAHRGGAMTGGQAAQSLGAGKSAEDPQLAAMRTKVQQSPDDMTALKVFAGMLGDSLRSNPSAPPELVFEAIDVFGKILQKEPNDPAALVMMADVSFDQRAFTKALDFYERYLKIDSEDLGARSRYASTLTFLGRYDDSIRELDSVLKKDPKNFPAMAYLAITYAQKGDVSTAKKIGGSALQMAPSEDARARFSSFVASLDGAAATSDGSAVNAKPASTGLSGLEQSLRANPVAGPKFVKADLGAAGTLTLVYRDFPMSQMPPFAKEKFLSGVKAALVQNKLQAVTKVEFTEATTGAEMESLKVDASK